MKEKFTKGPWFIHPDGPKHTVNQQGTNRHIAMASCYKTVESDDNENIANAHLIKTAPKMYDTLGVISRRIQNGSLDEWSLAAIVDLAERTRKEARGE